MAESRIAVLREATASGGSLALPRPTYEQVRAWARAVMPLIRTDRL